MATNEETVRESAEEFLIDANNHAGDAKAYDYAATSALIGIGYSLLEVADAIRDASRPTGIINYESSLSAEAVDEMRRRINAGIRQASGQIRPVPDPPASLHTPEAE